MDLEQEKSEVARLKIRKFNGNVYVDIRKYYDNGTKPTQKGISLRPDMFEKLANMKDLVEQSIELVDKRITSLSPQNAARATVMRDGDDVKVSIELDRGHQIGVSKFKSMMLIDVRNYYNGAPTKKGISLKPELFRMIANLEDWKEAVRKLA